MRQVEEQVAQIPFWSKKNPFWQVQVLLVERMAFVLQDRQLFELGPLQVLQNGLHWAQLPWEVR